MGWKEGQGLGSSQAASAITAPVQVEMNRRLVTKAVTGIMRV
jgi:hypothetical protein